MGEFLFAALIILGVAAVPCLAILIVVAIERLLTAPQVPAGRELAAEGIFSHLAPSQVVSTRGLRVLAYPVTVVCFQDRDPYLVWHVLRTELPAGTRVRLWRDPASDECALERFDQP